MEIKSYKDALDYLEDFIGKVIFKVPAKQDLNYFDPLERMRVLLSLLDNPQEKFLSILVGGTSGKGSTAYLISHILTTAGYKTGLTISPHLQKINERLQISGKEISNIEFTRMVASMIRIIERMKKMQVGAPSYFEILIAMAFLYFAKQKVNVAVVEVGMGGEFDATNTLSPLIAVLTNVSLDHTNVLGKTVQKIAKTKIGIIKSAEVAHENFLVHNAKKGSSLDRFKNPASAHNENFVGSPRLSVVTGVKQPSVIKIVEDRCKEVGAKLYRLHKDFELTNQRISLLGEYQKENASLAIQTVLQLRKFACLPGGRGFKVSEENIKEALKTAFFPGRFEVFRLTSFAQNKMSSTLILDGAHNPTKMRAFLSSLKRLYPKERPTSPSLRQGFGRRARLRGASKIFVIGFKNDKDISEMLKQITKVADEIIVTQFKGKTDTNIHASVEAKSIKHEALDMKYKGKINIERNSKKALKKAFKMESGIIVVTGSLYLVGEIRNML